MKRSPLSAALAGALVALPLVANAEPFTVGLWGDMPYAKANDAPAIPALIDSMNASDIAFSIYDGDIKDGSSECTDQIFADAAAMFNAMKAPVIYVPGDNEWTDCDRHKDAATGRPASELARLARLETLFFAEPVAAPEEI